MKAEDKIIFTPGTQSFKELQGYLKAFRGEIGAVRLGRELLTSNHWDDPVVQYVLEETSYKIMWDIRYDDIPATVAGAAKEAAKYSQGRILGFTVHCSSGKEVMKKAVEAVEERFGKKFDAPMIIAVNLRMSLDQVVLYESLGILKTPDGTILSLAKMAKETGARAIVCSPQETVEVLAVNPSLVVINYGVKFASLVTQKLVTTPGQAIANGASYIVMGSCLCKGDPLANARRAAEEIFWALTFSGNIEEKRAWHQRVLKGLFRRSGALSWRRM